MADTNDAKFFSDLADAPKSIALLLRNQATLEKYAADRERLLRRANLYLRDADGTLRGREIPAARSSRYHALFVDALFETPDVKRPFSYEAQRLSRAEP